MIAIQVQVPADAAVEPGDTLTLVAQALDKNGDVVSEPVYWRTPDPNLLDDGGLDRAAHHRQPDRDGRSAGLRGSLLSPLILITVHPPSDTLALVGPDTMTVPDADTASAPLDAAVQTLNPPAAYRLPRSATWSSTVSRASGWCISRAAECRSAP